MKIHVAQLCSCLNKYASLLLSLESNSSKKYFTACTSELFMQQLVRLSNIAELL
jgi:hypothetical protein